MMQFNVAKFDGPDSQDRIAWWVFTREDLRAILSYTADADGCDHVGFDPASGAVFATDGTRAMHAGPTWRPSSDPGECFAVPLDTLASVEFGVSLMIENEDDRVRVRGWGEPIRLPRVPPSSRVHEAFAGFAERLNRGDRLLNATIVGSLSRLERAALPYGMVEAPPTIERPGLSCHRHGGTLWSVVTPPVQPRADWSAGRRPTFLAVRNPGGEVTQGRPVVLAADGDASEQVASPIVAVDRETDVG